MQAGNLGVDGVMNPILDCDPAGDALINGVVAAIGAVAGWAFGDYVATSLNLEGWKYWAVRSGVTIGGAVIGWFAGATISAVAESFLISHPEVLAKMPGFVLDFFGINISEQIPTTQIVQTVATGQYHHVLSNPIMKALENHPTLSGLFDRATSVVQALTPEAHRGYQTWHRDIDNAMVAWLIEHPLATVNDFWSTLYTLYNTPDMIERFGMGVLNYIKGMMT